MLDAKSDRLEFLLSDYERRKQEETRRLVMLNAFPDVLDHMLKALEG